MRLAIITILCLWSCSTYESVQPNVPKSSTAVTPEMTILCDVIGAPQEYVGKTLKIRAVIRKGFENFEMYSLKCGKESNTTVALDYSDDLIKRDSIACDGSAAIAQLSYPLMGAKTFGVVVRGRFEARPDPPYVNPFRYSFVISCFDSVVTLDERGYIPASLIPEDRANIERFENN